MPPQTQATAAVGEESVQSRPRSDMRFFFHMPKTAGGTLVRGIMRNAQVKWPLDPHYPRPLALPALSPAAQVWLGGHSAFGLHLLYNAEPTYITILREPVERLITEFFYHHEHNLPGMFIPDDEIIPAFVRHVEAAPHLNAYTYMFSDYCFAKESIEAGQGTWDGSIDTAFDLLRRRNERFGFLSDNIPFQRVDINDAFRKASNNVHAMHFIGFFDRLDETVAYLSEDFGLNVSLDAAVHQTKWKPKTEDLPGHIQAMLKRKTEADREFYDSVRRHSGLYQGEKFDRIEKQLTSLGARVAATADELAMLKTRVTAMTDEIAALAKLEALVTTTRDEVSMLKSRVEAVTDEVASFRETKALHQRNKPLIELMRPLAVAIRKLRSVKS